MIAPGEDAMEEIGLYLVMTNPLVGYERCCEAAVRAGVRMVQLRMKHRPRAEIVEMAKKLRAITAGTATRFIVNDDPSIAAESGADGVHVGQDDMPVAEVRRRYPMLGIVGLSTHNIDQARLAVAAQPDYIGVGPVWATPTKDIPDPTLGIDAAVAMVKSVPFPAVCIGGIDESRLPALLGAGVVNYSVVRAVCGSPDPYAAILRLREIGKRAVGGD